MAHPKTITTDMWITEVLLDTNYGKCTAITCIHRVGTSDDEVYTIKLGETVGWKAQEMGELFMHRAKMSVQGIAGSQLFYLYAFYNGRNEPQAKFPFRIDNGSDLGNGMTEPPTNEGKAQQNMRMTEAGFQFFFKQSIEMFSLQSQALQESRAHERLLMAENRDAFSIVKELLMAQANQNHTFKLEEIKAKRSADQIDAVMRLGPAIVNSITGREVFPQSTEDTALVEGLIDNLTEEQARTMASLLPAHIMGPLAARAEKHWKAKQAAQSAAMSAVEGRKDPVLEDGEEESTTQA